MTETVPPPTPGPPDGAENQGIGAWPLIPREVFPAPVPAVRRRLPPRPSPDHELGRQLAFFAAETSEPSPADLAGLLAGPGRLGRMGGTARVTVEVDAAWRVHVLVAELVARGLVASWRPLEDQIQEDVRDDDSPGPADAIQAVDNQPEPESPPIGSSRKSPPADEHPDKGTIDEEPDEPAPRPRFEVLTAYSQRLNGLARAWPEAAAQLFLSGPRLRLWVAAAGTPHPGGYALRLEPGRHPSAIDAALVRAGLAGKFSPTGEHYLIAGKKRLRRLAELVGDRPETAPADLWPGGAGA
jgi:hypothetical protein